MLNPEELLNQKILLMTPKLSHPKKKVRHKYGKLILELTMKYNSVGKYNLNLVKKLACEAVGIKQQKLIKKEKTRQIVIARQLCFWYLRKVSKEELRLERIGKIFGGKNHATIIYGIKCVNEKEFDPVMAESFDKFKFLILKNDKYLWRNIF